MTRDVAGGRYVGKEAQNFLLKEELEKNNSEGLTVALYFIVYFTVQWSVHPRIEIDMSVFEAPL